MMTVAVIFSTSHGQTRKIARFLAESFEKRLCRVELIEISKYGPIPPWDPLYDAIILGAPVYLGRFPKPLIQWARKHRLKTSSKVTGFFSVSLNAADPSPLARKADQDLISSFQHQVGWDFNVRACFRGALMYLQYNWLLKQIMKRISRRAGGPLDTKKNFELTDWSEVEKFADRVLAELIQRTSS